MAFEEPRIKHLEQTGIPERLRSVWWQPWHEDRLELKERAQAWCAGFHPGRKGLFLFGPVGTGKTFLAAWIAAELTRYPFKSVKWLGFNEIQQTIKNHDYLPYLRDELAARKLYIIDELTGYDGEILPWVADEAAAWFNELHTRNVTTIFTSNLDPCEGDIARTFGERFNSRLAEMCQLVKLTGRDRRADGKILIEEF